MPIEPTADPPPIEAGAVGGGRDRPGLAATGCGERVGGGGIYKRAGSWSYLLEAFTAGRGSEIQNLPKAPRCGP